MDDLGHRTVYEFPIGRWFAIDEDDGKIQRDILVGGSQPTGVYEPEDASRNKHNLYISPNGKLMSRNTLTPRITISSALGCVLHAVCIGIIMYSAQRTV